ncbi:MAG: hypothetical protein J6C27_00840 [Clostridia bacterium]|nr:hypothetical protein [Clostridia bacterium]
MEFNLRAYIKKGLLLAIGNKPEYEIRLISGEWLSKGVLIESDLAEIEEAINKKNEEVSI